MKDEHRDEAIKALYGLIDSLKNAQEIKVFDVENKNILNTFRYELKPTGWREISMNIVFKPKTNIDIEKIKKAIKFSCGYVTYNPDETCVVLPQSLNYNDGITLNREEYESRWDYSKDTLHIRWNGCSSIFGRYCTPSLPKPFDSCIY